jgi:hypothetical protein
VFLAKIDIEFTKEIKNQFGAQMISYLKFKKIDKTNYFQVLKNK